MIPEKPRAEVFERNFVRRSCQVFFLSDLESDKKISELAFRIQLSFTAGIEKDHHHEKLIMTENEFAQEFPSSFKKIKRFFHSCENL